MTIKSKKDLTNLPDEFRELFINTTAQIRRSSDVLFMADFSFLTNQMVFLTDYGDKAKNSRAESFRKLFYETFYNDNREFIDEKIQELESHHQQYIENLYTQGLIYLWTSLESFFKELLQVLIEYDEQILAAESFKKISIPMMEYYGLPKNEISSYLAELVIGSLKCGHMHGAERFECYLEAFGLNGAFSAQHKKRLSGLHHLRNCIVHNDSTADARLCNYCAWMGYKKGDKIVITDDAFRNYEESVLAYITEIFYRLNEEFGAPETYLTSLRKKIDHTFKKNVQKT